MTESDIINRLSHWTDQEKFPWQLACSFIYKWECDYWTMTSGGETREFEIKISRSDYLIDAKKDKHQKLTEGANYFYYVVPEGLIKPEEVAKNYGLIYVSEKSVQVVKKPKRLHSNEFDKWKLLANKMYWKFRDLWRAKRVAEQMPIREYWEGFQIQLLEEETAFESLNKQTP